MERATTDQGSQAGMSLIEVTISLVVLGVVLVGLGQGLTLGIRLNNESKLRVTGLGVCKQITEKLKSRIQYSQETFDSANVADEFNKTFYVDQEGVEIEDGEDSRPAAFRVEVSVGDLTDADGNTMAASDSEGVSNVLVKFLDIKVRTLSGMGSDASRDVTMRVEMVRPAGSPGSAIEEPVDEGTGEPEGSESTEAS